MVWIYTTILLSIALAIATARMFFWKKVANNLFTVMGKNYTTKYPTLRYLLPGREGSQNLLYVPTGKTYTLREAAKRENLIRQHKKLDLEYKEPLEQRLIPGRWKDDTIFPPD